jgi:hypothetical protein
MEDVPERTTVMKMTKEFTGKSGVTNFFLLGPADLMKTIEPKLENYFEDNLKQIIKIGEYIMAVQLYKEVRIVTLSSTMDKF